jgi:hypothetical protein
LAYRTHHLPGFRFEVQAPPPSDVLPRLDIACFVGFAASGPLHRPVRVTSIAQFEMIFGADASLAWDEEKGEPIYAYLAPSVRAFFRNGGRLAWIVRVAGRAQTNYFPLSSMLQASFDPLGKVKSIRPAYAQARSAGSWADGVRVSTSLMSRSIIAAPITFDPPQFEVSLSSPADLVVGDMLRFTFHNGMILVCAVNSLKPSTVSPGPNHYLVSTDKAVWFKAGWRQSPSSSIGQAISFTHEAESAAITATVPFKLESPVALDWPTQDQQTPIKLDLDLTDSITLPPGSLLRVDFGADHFWMRVEDVNAGEAVGSPLIDQLRVTGQGLWWTSTPANVADSIDLVERLSFELWTRTGEEKLLRLSDLTFDLRHARAWDALPTDLQLFPEMGTLPASEHLELWSAAGGPRFPLAGQEHPATIFVPLAMPLLPDFYLAPDRPTEDALTRDGLATFSEELFLDPHLGRVGVRDLINQADTLRYYTPHPYHLTGIHSVLDLDEVTLIAVPDAVHRGWLRKEPSRPPDPLPSAPPIRPEWWHFLDCDPKPVIPATHEPARGNFLNCTIRVISVPYLHNADAGSDTFTIHWESSEPGLTFILQEATRTNFDDAVDIYMGSDNQFTFYGHTPGVFYYRVRGVVGDQSSDWSNGVVVSIGASRRWTLEPASWYSEGILQRVQQALLRLCAARGDLFAVLALPQHYLEDDTVAYIQTLITTGSGFLGPEEPRTHSFGALYHPWLLGREENAPGVLRRTPPDGAMTGMIARRTLDRGAWVAPANEFLKGVVALIPEIDRSRRQELQDVQLNLIRHEPRGFTVLNNDTLSRDEDLRPINVRRLLLLLRRLAVRLGPTYVFEPNDPAFRRSVQRGFESLLDSLFLRGAFAGATAGTSYQVVIDSSVNSSQAVDQGRFTVELRVAPSLPLRFLSIRLVQTGDRTLVTEEV